MNAGKNIFSERLKIWLSGLSRIERVFFLLCASRLFYPFYNQPMLHMEGLGGRQYEQAKHFLTKDIMGGGDSFLFQFWMYLARSITLDAAWAMHLIAGGLCMLLPVAWYLFARELLGRTWAVWVGLVIALNPSLLTIYGYFASETLLLPLMGLAFWQSTKCYYAPGNKRFFICGVLWLLAAHTRLVALPMGCVVLLVLWFRVPRKVVAIASMILPIMLVTGAAAYHSKYALGFYAPFGLPELNAFMARANASHVMIHEPGKPKPRWFRSPSYYLYPLRPLSDWRINDLAPPVHVTLEKKNSRQEWKDQLARYPITWESYSRQIKNNVITLFFGSSWPEAWPPYWEGYDQYHMWESDLNYHIRWIWAPLVIWVAFFSLRYRADVLRMGFVALTLGMLLLVSFQFTCIMEGRYRKPMEPMLIVSAALLRQQQKQRVAT